MSLNSFHVNARWRGGGSAHERASTRAGKHSAAFSGIADMSCGLDGIYIYVRDGRSASRDDGPVVTVNRRTSSNHPVVSCQDLFPKKKKKKKKKK